MKMSSNTVLITGGSSGIGYEFAKRFRELGNTVIVTGRDGEKLDRVRSELPGIHTFQSDVSDPVAIASLYAKVVGQFPKLNVLVNNAGIMCSFDLRDESVASEDLVREIETNLSGPIRMVREFLPQLKTQGSAAIINVSSGLAFIPFFLSPIYGATKAGIHSYTQALRVQLKNSPVRVFELAPPATDTPLTDAFESSKAVGTMKTEAMVARALRGLQRDEEEILPGFAAVLKLMSRLAPRFFFRQFSRVARRMSSRT